jgi:hypothetical protein
MGMSNQKFTYNHENKSWRNTGTGNAIDVHGDELSVGQNAVTEPADGTRGQKWDIFYCDYA